MINLFFHGKPDVGVPGVDVVEKYTGIVFRVKLAKSIINIPAIKYNCRAMEIFQP